MALADYTSYDEIRAVLGVADDEIKDDTLSLDIYNYGFRMELADISATLETDFLAIVAKDNAARSAAEQAVFEGVKVFAPYAVAVMLFSSLPLFSPKDITDGMAATGRYADSPYKVVIERTQQKYEKYKSVLQVRYAALVTSGKTAALRPWFSVVAPSVDPVTGA